jgi:hypothetical protein
MLHSETYEMPGLGIYKGDYTDEPHGEGVLTWFDGSEFKGEFDFGKISGYGVYRDRLSGKVIEGWEWK